MSKKSEMKRHRLAVILSGSRLGEYESTIREALDNGYICCGLYEYTRRLAEEPDSKYLILRHDVDGRPIAARKMFELERKLGVTSTYYFRDCTFDKKLIGEMNAAGFEVGYHFETLAYMKQQKLIECAADIAFDTARSRFRNELAAFEEKAGFKTHTCASHGADENDLMKISNNAIFDGISAAELGVDFEAYDKSIYGKYGYYHIMDAPITRRMGYSYVGKTPHNGIERGERAIILLTHPENWYASPRRTAYYIAVLLGGKATLPQE